MPTKGCFADASGYYTGVAFRDCGIEMLGVQRAVGTTHATPPVHGRAHHPRRGDRIAGSNHAPCMLLGGG